MLHIDRKVCTYSLHAVPVSDMSLKAVILVVEDSPLILMGALDLVTSAGYEGVGAASADEAIAILEARPNIHLVFTDVEMPGSIDGVSSRIIFGIDGLQLN